MSGRCLRLCLLGCCLLGSLAATVEPAAAAYKAWGQGRPDEATRLLLQSAEAQQRWDRFCDAALAAERAGWPGVAAAAAMRAYQLRPDRDEPLRLLRQLQVPVPATPSEQLGPFAWAGSSWWGVLVLGAGAFALGFGLRARRGPWLWRGLGLALVLVAAPGIVGNALSDAGRWCVPAVDTHLLDSTGAPLDAGAVAGGSLLRRLDDRVWEGRCYVERRGDTSVQRGWLPLDDCRPQAGLP